MEVLWTIGHSTHPLDEFLAMLASQEIRAVADVRHFPGSRRYPQFGKEALAASLKQAGVRYEHFLELGGRRRPRADSPNSAWRHPAFRGYADYMETAEFRAGVERLRALGREMRTAMMCSEAVWWRCHRGLIADYLKVRGVEVIHIFSGKKTEPHPFTSAARIVNGELSYAGLSGL